MIKLKPFYKVGIAPDVIFLMSEIHVHQVPLTCKPLIEQLQTDNFDPQALSDDDLERLKRFDEIGIVYNAPITHVDLVNFYELKGWRGTQVLEQLKHTRIDIANYSQDSSYQALLSEKLSLLGFTVNSSSPTLTVNIVERLNQVNDFVTPSLHVRLGSYIPSVGPLLCSTLTAKALKAKLEIGKKFFEETSFLVNLPPPLKDLSVGLVAHEICETVIKGGNHDTYKNIIEWNLANMKRTAWPF